jgi:hypothetical protein
LLKGISITFINQGSISPTCLLAAFTQADLKRAKRQASHYCGFALLESFKAARKIFVKLTTEERNGLRLQKLVEK